MECRLNASSWSSGAGYISALPPSDSFPVFAAGHGRVSLKHTQVQASLSLTHEDKAPAKPTTATTLIRLGDGNIGSIGNGNTGTIGNGSVRSENAAVLRSVYLDLLQSVSFSNTRESCYPDQLDAIAARLSAVCGPFVAARRTELNLGAGFADLVYKLHPIEVRVKVAHFVAFFIIVDDLASKLAGDARVRYLDDLSLFQMKHSNPDGYRRLHPTRGDLHPVLEELVVYLKSDQNPFFPGNIRLHSMLVKSVLDFIEANLTEQHYEKRPLAYAPEMLHLPKFLRHKSGISEPFVYMLLMNTAPTSWKLSLDEEHFFYNKLFPMVPELVDAFDYLNDLLSFYKEVDDGEDAICILSYAKIHRMTPLQAVKESVEYVVDLRARVMALVDKAGSAEMKNKVMQYFQGYLSFHIGNRRYRLQEVLGGWYQGGFWV